jgi:GTPase
VRFIDEATITVQSGNGGPGCVSFRRERFIPRGGPDGGDGGDGGDIVLTADTQRRTLYHFQYKKHIKAQNGTAGRGKQQTGKSGDDLVVEIPPGTVVSDAQTGEILRDFDKFGDTFVIAKGGRGGLGNRRFKTSTNRAPRFAQPGEPGQTLTLQLELKLLADIGIVGLPNAGKSTLISVLSSATPKIGDYPFTTLTPNLGVVKVGAGEPFVIADIPGLIEGAHKGAGLGIRFLRHIERTRLTVHIIDASAIDPSRPLHDFRTIRNELSAYSRNLAEKPYIVALNKLDLPGAESAAEAFLSNANDMKVLLISAINGTGIEDLKRKMLETLDTIHE